MLISSIRNAKSYCSLHWVLLLRKTIENHSVEPSLFLSLIYFPSKYFQFRSVTQSCPTLCNPMNRSTPGLPVHHQLPEFTQTHVHRVGDAIQPSHPLSSPSLPAFNLSQHQGLFRWVSSSHQVAKVLEFQLQHQSQYFKFLKFPLQGVLFFFFPKMTHHGLTLTESRLVCS